MQENINPECFTESLCPKPIFLLKLEYYYDIHWGRNLLALVFIGGLLSLGEK
jgi:hypothetical protein